MSCQQNPRAAGMSFLGAGVAFTALSQAHGLSAFLGVGMAFLGLSVASLVRSRRGC